jgi:hypothetical protein
LVPEVVTFRWRDSAHHNEQKLLTLVLDKFLCRFLLHILPQGFRRIRNFGFFGQPQTRHTPTPLLSVFGIGTTAAEKRGHAVVVSSTAPKKQRNFGG